MSNPRSRLWLYVLLVAIAISLVLGFRSYRSIDSATTQHSKNAGSQLDEVVSQRKLLPDGDHTKLISSVDRSHEPIAGNAMDLIAELEPRAQNGDVEAAFELYLKLNSCFYETKGNLIPDDKFEEAGIAKSAAESTERALIDCEGLTASDYKSRGRWLAVAADQGVIEAQLLFASDPEAILGDSSEMLANPERVKEYRRKAIDYLHEAASRGNLNALMQLSNAYKRGILVDRNLVNSYAYYRAAQRAMPSIGAGAQMQRRYEQQLSAAEIRESSLLADSIYRKCCQ